MAGPLHFRLWILPVSAAAALAAGVYLPGTRIDRLAFTGAARGIANPPFFVSGGGKPGDPWQLRTMAAAPAEIEAAPAVVAMGDDPEGFFQSSPAAPIDIAVVLRNFQRLGADKAAVGLVLAWDEPDPIGLAALDKVLAGFDSLVMCAPLGRGAVPEPLPAAFRNASLAADGIDGAQALPIVNRIPLSGVILGETAAAGFQSLESEPATGALPLLARWDDRVVLAFPLLAAMQRLGVPPGQLEIRLGKFLRLGADGPVLPIDAQGRIARSSLRQPDAPAVAARDMIDRSEPLVSGGEPVLFRDDRSAADDGTRRFSATLVPAVATLASPDGLSESARYPRLRETTEWIVLGCLALLATAAAGPRGMARWVLLSLLAAGVTIAQLLGFGAFGTWLPGLPALAAVAAAAMASLLPVRRISQPAPIEPPPPEKPPRQPRPRKPAEQETPPAKNPAAKPTAKKEPAKKTPAKKTPPKKRKK